LPVSVSPGYDRGDATRTITSPLTEERMKW
jgi:hypothetical protein